MFDEMNKCRDMFLKFGGHPLAAGLSMEESKVEPFRKKINELSDLTEEQLKEKIHIDLRLPVEYVSMDLIKQLNVLSPFGKANTKPIFVDKDLKVQKMSILGKNKNVLRLNLISEKGKRITAIYFGDIDDFREYYGEKYGYNEVESALMGKNNKILISMVYYPAINAYNGNESIQFQIQYYR